MRRTSSPWSARTASSAGPTLPTRPSPSSTRSSSGVPFPRRRTSSCACPPACTTTRGALRSIATIFRRPLATDSFPPLAKFAARFGIVEWEADPVLPVTLRNLDPEIQGQEMRVTEERQAATAPTCASSASASRERGARVAGRAGAHPALAAAARGGQARQVDLRRHRPDGGDRESLHPAEAGRRRSVRGGRHAVPRPRPLRRRAREPAPRRGAARRRASRCTCRPAALVTNLAVHLKWGTRTRWCG